VVAEKKPKPFSATQYSMKYLRRQGLTVEKTEQTVRAPDPVIPNKWKTWKRDLFNFSDIVGVHPEHKGTLYVQTTTTDHQADRIHKIAGLAVVQLLIKAGNRIHVHGWGKKGPRGGRKVWQVTVTEIGFDQDGLLTTKIVDSETLDEQQHGLDFEQEEF